MRKLKLGLMGLCLLTLLSGCVKPQIRLVAAEIPEALLEDCPETEVEVRVNADLPKKVKSLQYDLAECNATKREIKSFIGSISKK